MSERRNVVSTTYPVMRWAAKWCAETVCKFKFLQCVSQTCGFVIIRVIDNANGNELDVRLYPGDTAEVCGYLPKGWRRGKVVTFDEYGGIVIDKMRPQVFGM